MRRRLGALSALLCASVSAAQAAGPQTGDPQGLSTFVPVQTEDALVVNPGVFELQGYSLFTHDHFNKAGSNLLELNPTIKFGPVRHVQLDISAPYNVGNQSTANQGNASINGIYQFTDPGPLVPALAAQAGYQFFNYGPGRASDQYFVRGLATKWLGSDNKAPRLHLNVDWTHATNPGQGSRSDILAIGVAYSQLVTSDTAFVTDIVHGAKPAAKQVETIVDVGLRHLIADNWAVSGSVGTGLGQQSPGFRALFAVQKEFHLF